MVIVALFICQYLISWVLRFEFTSWFSYNTIFIFAGAVSLFMTFKNLDIQSGMINKIAKPCLAVYLIHKHPCIWPVVCKMVDISSYHGQNFILIVLLLPIPVYIVSILIEMLRVKIFTGVEGRILNMIFK